MSMILVNGERHKLLPTLPALLDALGLKEAIVATAVNGNFIAIDQRATINLKAGDQVEILAPMQGG